MVVLSLALWLVDAAFICCHRDRGSVDRGSPDRLGLYLHKSIVTFLCFTQTQVKYICVADLFIIILYVFKLVEMCFKS